MPTPSLRNRLKQAHAQHGLTQADLATRIGVSRKTVNTIENGVFVPSTTLALMLAQAFGVSVEDLFWLDPSPAAALAEPEA